MDSSLAAGEKRKQVANEAVIFDRVTQREIAMEPVMVVSTLTFTGDVTIKL